MSFLRSAATVGSFTMASRLLGFVRDVLLASIVGTGPVTDAFVVAFRFPNLFRRLFGEGAFNSAFIPLFAKRLQADGEKQAYRFAGEVLSGLLFVLLIVTALAEIAMPLLMYLLAPGFASEPEKFDLAVLLTRIAFPYLLFMSLVALVSGILNSFNRFAAAAAAPIILNVVLIAVLASAHFLQWGNTTQTGVALVWGVSLSGFLQLLMVWYFAVRNGMQLSISRPRLTGGVRRLVRLGVPGVIAGGIAQVNLLISTVIASFQDGAPSWLYYADRVYQFPLGIVGVAIGIVLLPDLSKKLRENDGEGVVTSQNRALEFALFLTIPSSVALMAIPGPVVATLFERGAFSAADTHATSLALGSFAAGLPAYVMIKVFSPAFFAREDTLTPMIYAAAGVAVNTIGAIILAHFIGHTGIALATSLAAWINVWLLALTLTKRGYHQNDKRLSRNVFRIIAASMLMGFLLLFMRWVAADAFAAGSPLLFRGLVLAVMVLAGAASYLVAAYWTGAIDVEEIKSSLRRR